MENKYVIFFLLFQTIYNLKAVNQYHHFISITFLDNIYNSFQLLPFTDEEGFLYMVTGGTSQKEPLYTRNILKFNASSGDLYENKTIFANNQLLDAEILFLGDNSQYLLTATSSTFEIYNGTYFGEYNIINIANNRKTLLNLGQSSFFYSYLTFENKNFYLIKMKLIYDKNGKLYLMNELSKQIKEEITNQNMISCDKTKDNKYISCIYYSQIYSSIAVSIFSNEFEEIAKTQFLGYNDTDFHLKSFKKIFYFKDLYKFILINSLDDDIINLRYFEYNNNKFINKLKFPNYNDDYLNISGTQDIGDYNKNDAIIFDLNKIIKIFAHKNTIIITIIQFYDNDSILTIKKFNLENINFINMLLNPRLAIFRNSIVVCLSASILNEDKVGFFFIGYPESNDIFITKNENIKINDIISIRNNIFSLGLNIKILKIPEDFIFSSSLAEIKGEIKTGDYLVQYDELIFRQYKKKKKVSLIFEGLAIGEYDEYSSIEIYSSDAIIPKEVVNIKGTRGTINIEINNCNNGFHEVESFEDICINIQPKGYYLDELFNIYRKCHPMCEECFDGSNDDTKMNCIKCKDDYFLNNKTNNCLSVEPNKRIEEIERETSPFYLIFLFIFIFSILFAIFYICWGKILNLLCSRNNKGKNKKDEKEKQLEIIK